MREAFADSGLPRFDKHQELTEPCLTFKIDTNIVKPVFAPCEHF
jgi:hypothetical protein